MIIGHKKNIVLLNKMVKTNRLPHALLFSGPEGIGKRIIAVEVAAALNCSSLNDSGGACGECLSCSKLAFGGHPLIRFVGSSKNESEIEIISQGKVQSRISNIIPVDEEKVKKTEKINIYQIRTIIRESSLKPYGAGKKVFIIDDIASSSDAAQNAILKVLEEPPLGTFFILITSQCESLPLTITSRCETLEFNPLSSEEMKEVVDKNLPLKDKEKAILLIPFSGGSPGRLMRFLKFENIVLSDLEAEDFFKETTIWLEDKSQCVVKLSLLLEKEGSDFRKRPSGKGYHKIMVIEETIDAVKKNVNPSLAVANMFLKLGAVQL